MNVKSLTFTEIVLLLIAISFAIIILFPIYWVIIGSIQPHAEIFTYPPNFLPAEITLDNFRAIFQLDIPFYTYFLNSLFVAIAHTVGTLIISAMAGFALAQYNFKGKYLILALVIGGMLVPFQALLVPLFLIHRNLGLVDSRIALVVPFIANPLGVFLMRQYMVSVPKSMIDAARIDGATEFRILFQLVCPIVKPAFAALGIVNYVLAWNAFVWPLTILQSQEKFTLPIWLNSLLQDPYMGADYGLMFAGAALTVIPVIIIFLYCQNYFIEGLAAGVED